MTSRTLATIENVTVATSVGSSSEIPFEGFEFGAVIIPTGSAVGTLSWYGAESQTQRTQVGSREVVNSVTGLGQNFVPIYAAGVAVTQAVVAGRGYAFPDAVKGFAALKIVGDAAGVLIVSLKS